MVRWTGIVLAVGGLGAVTGYLAYLYFTQFLFESEAHLALRVGVTASIAGIFLLLASVVWERRKARGHEKLDEVKP